MPCGQGVGSPLRSEGRGRGTAERPPCRKLQGANDSLSLHQVVIGQRVIGFSLERGRARPGSVLGAHPHSSGRELSTGSTLTLSARGGAERCVSHKSIREPPR